MDFKNVKKIDIPEGSVKELSIGGQVVWKMKAAGVTINFTNNSSYITGAARVSLYVGNDADGYKQLTSGDTVWPKNYKLKCFMTGDSNNGHGSYIYLNGSEYAYESGKYNHKTTKYIELSKYSKLTIIVQPEGRSHDCVARITAI